MQSSPTGQQHLIIGLVFHNFLLVHVCIISLSLGHKYKRLSTSHLKEGLRFGGNLLFRDGGDDASADKKQAAT